MIAVVSDKRIHCIVKLSKLCARYRDAIKMTRDSSMSKLFIKSCNMALIKVASYRLTRKLGTWRGYS